MFNPIAVFIHTYVLAAAVLVSPWFLVVGAVMVVLSIVQDVREDIR